MHNLLPQLHSADAQAVYQAIFLSDKDFLPLRLSYALDLQGPSVSVQTACWTSLVAIHQACRSLQAGECAMALAGGVGLKIPQASGYLYEDGMISSPDGHCRAFDAEAKGTVWGSGVGVVLLKPLAAALADRDTIHAVIKGSAVNNDGALKVGFTAPGVAGQAQAIAQAQAQAGVTPDSIGYVEAHGTGTALGDPIEIAALTRAFQGGTADNGFCALGSVKTNIGHLDAASGVAGFIKTVLALRHGQIPPSLHFHTPHPQIDWAGSPFFVNDRLRDWPAGATPSRAGVSSFGIGGTNAHAVLEEAPLRPARAATTAWRVLLLSARSPAALAQMQAGLSAHLAGHAELDLADAAYTLSLGRRPFGQRAAWVCRDREDAVAALAAPDRTRTGTAAPGRELAFLFPGQGAQRVAMGAGLYWTQTVFRELVDYCAERLRPELGLDLREVLYPPAGLQAEAAERLEQTWLTQPALFVIEYALARQWLAWGVRPAAMIGHSLGEYVAACLAGVFDLDTALHLVAVRGRLIFAQPPGAMLAAPLAVAALRVWLRDQPELSLAAVNAAEACVVSGPFAAVDALAEKLAAAGIASRRLRTSHAFHSAMLEPMQAEFSAVLAKVKLQAPTLPFVSNLTGDWISPEQATDPAYWAKHLRHTVEFEADLSTLLADGSDRLLLEVGPGTTLADLARRHPQAQGRTVLASLGRTADDEAETRNLLDALARLWTLGADIDWPAFYGDGEFYRVPLPGYAFERQRYWVDAPGTGSAAPTAALRAGRQSLDDWFYLPSWKPTLALPAAADLPNAGPWLLFSDGSELCRQLQARWAQAGAAVTVAVPGERFGRDGTSYTLRPGAAEDYAALLREFADRPFQHIVHGWSLTPPDAEPGGAAFRQAQETGYYSLLWLGQALAAQAGQDAVTLTVISRRLHDVHGLDAESISPEQATLLGPCLVLPQEHPHIVCRCVDVGPAADSALADALLAELRSAAKDTHIACRGGRRLAQSFEPTPLPAEGAAVREIRERGVYLITGGLGQVGLQFARFLAETAQARLVLLGSSPFPARADWEAWLRQHPQTEGISHKIRQLLALETQGAEVLTLSADVSDAQALTAALAQSEAQFAPKAHGLYALEQALGARRLDFCLLVSSTAAVLGGLGFTAYSAANAFADAFAASRNRPGATPWLSVNWDAFSFDAGAGGGRICDAAGRVGGGAAAHRHASRIRPDHRRRRRTQAALRAVGAARQPAAAEAAAIPPRPALSAKRIRSTCGCGRNPAGRAVAGVAGLRPGRRGR
ncbi:MAG: type I polyketide synthase, partial [Candidatus Methylumidiphilus sp.]